MCSPLFSILVPVYNVAPWLDEALDSLHVQTCRDWEAICVEDGSSDNSGEVLLEHVRKEGRLRVIFQPNGGLSHARNRALKYVRGRYLGFFDSDDAVAPWWLEEAARRFSETGADLVRFDRLLWRGKQPPVGERKEGLQLLTRPEEIQAWGWRVFVKEAFVWRYFLQWERVRSLRFIDALRMKEDCLYGLYLLPHLVSVCDCASTPYYYRMRATSLLHTTCSVEVTLRLLAEAERLLMQPCAEGLLPVRNEALAHFIFHAIADWVTRRDVKEKKRYREVVQAFARILAEGTLSFRAIVPWHWRLSVRLFLTCGWIAPMRLHSFLYRAYLRLFCHRL